MSGSPEQSSLNDPFNIREALEGVHNLYDQVAKDMGSGLHDVQVTAENLASKIQLPDLRITDANHSVQTAAAKSAPLEGSAHPSLLTEIGNVAKAAGTGALNEAEEHPGQLAIDLAIGAGVGVATGAAIGALGVGAVAASPWVLAGAAATGVGAVGFEAYTHWDEITHDTSAVADPSAHSRQEVEDSTKSVQAFGAGALQNIAAIGGAIAGGPIGYGITSAADSVALGAAVNSAGVGEVVNSASAGAVANSAGVGEAVNSAGVGAADNYDILDAIRFGKYDDSLSLREVVDFFRGTAAPIPSTETAAGAAEISSWGQAGITAPASASAATAHAAATGAIATAG